MHSHVHHSRWNIKQTPSQVYRVMFICQTFKFLIQTKTTILFCKIFSNMNSVQLSRVAYQFIYSWWCKVLANICVTIMLGQ